VRTDVTEGAMKEFMYELNRLRDEPVTADELENAKRAIVGSFALSLESPQALLGNIVTQKLYNLPADYWDTYPQKVDAITVADVQRVAQKYIDKDHLQVVAVGDASKAKDVLSRYGTVLVFDADGKPIDANR
jgi:predicted Zn-dependent peptidase